MLMLIQKKSTSKHWNIKNIYTCI